MYYWRALVESTGEIMVQGNFPSIERASHGARSFIESRWFAEPDETYKVSVHMGEPPSQEPWEPGPEVKRFTYIRHGRGW